MALVGVLATAGGGPVLGGAASGVATLLAKGLAKNATLRMLEEGERFDDERDRQRALQRLLRDGVEAVLSEPFRQVLDRLEQMDEERREDLHAAPIVTSVEDLRDVRHITELWGKEAMS